MNKKQFALASFAWLLMMTMAFGFNVHMHTIHGTDDVVALALKDTLVVFGATALIVIAATMYVALWEHLGDDK